MKRTAQLDMEAEMAAVAQQMRAVAATGVMRGRLTLDVRRYIRKCTRVHSITGTNLIFTRDTEHHTSGWMRNPQFERCLHLSLSPSQSPIFVPGMVRDLDKITRALWLRAFFGDDLKCAWAESPKTREGIAASVWHWRVFCDKAWNPILPIGEVYSSELTEKGWRSASQVLEEDGLEIISAADPT